MCGDGILFFLDKEGGWIGWYYYNFTEWAADIRYIKAYDTVNNNKVTPHQASFHCSINHLDVDCTNDFCPYFIGNAIGITILVWPC